MGWTIMTIAVFLLLIANLLVSLGGRGAMLRAIDDVTAMQKRTNDIFELQAIIAGTQEEMMHASYASHRDIVGNAAGLVMAVKIMHMFITGEEDKIDEEHIAADIEVARQEAMDAFDAAVTAEAEKIQSVDISSETREMTDLESNIHDLGKAAHPGPLFSDVVQPYPGEPNK